MGSLLSSYDKEDSFEELDCDLVINVFDDLNNVNEHTSLPYTYNVNKLLAYIDVCINDNIDEQDKDNEQLVF